MSEWAPKRFWTSVSVVETKDGFAVELDGRSVRTPAKALLSVPTDAMAQMISEEWERQVERVDPTTMPWTRSANAAIDKLALQRREVEDHLVSYAGTDLLCYRADGPDGLTALQAESWDPILDWLAARHGVRLATTAGVMPVAQELEVLDRLKVPMREMNNFALTGFHDLVTLSGSFALALTVVEQARDSEEVWQLSRLDEEWQAEQWGRDAEAEEAAEIKRQAFLHATSFYRAA